MKSIRKRIKKTRMNIEHAIDKRKNNIAVKISEIKAKRRYGDIVSKIENEMLAYVESLNVGHTDLTLYDINKADLKAAAKMFARVQESKLVDSVYYEDMALPFNLYSHKILSDYKMMPFIEVDFNYQNQFDLAFNRDQRIMIERVFGEKVYAEIEKNEIKTSLGGEEGKFSYLTNSGSLNKVAKSYVEQASREKNWDFRHIVGHLFHHTRGELSVIIPPIISGVAKQIKEDLNNDAEACKDGREPGKPVFAAGDVFSGLNNILSEKDITLPPACVKEIKDLAHCIFDKFISQEIEYSDFTKGVACGYQGEKIGHNAFNVLFMLDAVTTEDVYKAYKFADIRGALDLVPKSSRDFSDGEGLNAGPLCDWYNYYRREVQLLEERNQQLKDTQQSTTKNVDVVKEKTL